MYLVKVQQGLLGRLAELKTVDLLIKNWYVKESEKFNTSLESGNSKTVKRHTFINMNSTRETSRSQPFSN